MPDVKIDQVQALGVVQDVDPIDLPPNAWTTANNARMLQTGIKTISPHSLAMVPLSIEDATGIFYYGYNDVDYWVTANADDIGVDNGTGSGYKVLTREATTYSAGYSAATELGWNGGILHGILLLNCYNAKPLFWTGDQYSAGSAPAIFTNWPGGSGGLIDARARVVRPHKNFVFALNIVDDSASERFEQRLMWSDLAQPGTMPQSWDYTDETKLAGWKDFSDTNGAVIDGLSLGNLFLVYKEDSVWGVNFIGAPLVWEYIRISEDINIWSEDCVVSFPGGHAVLTNGDFIVHAGTGEFVSPLDNRNRRWLFQNISSDYPDRCFVTKQTLYNEIWICFASQGSTLCDKALVWNWVTGAQYVRDIDGCRVGTRGLSRPIEEAQSWDGDSNAWSSSGIPWDYDPASVTRQSLVMTGAADEQASTGTADTSFLRLMDVYDDDVLQNTLTLERLDLSIAGQKSDGQPIVDRKIRKLVTDMLPRFQWNDGGMTLQVSVGGRENPHDAVTYDFVTNYDPDTEDYLFPIVNYPLIAIKFEITFTLATYGEATFYGYSLEISPAGTH